MYNFIIYIYLLITSHGLLAVIADDIIYSPTDNPRPQRSSYSLDTGFVCISIFSNPALRIISSSSSTEEAPDTQQECMASSSFISCVSSFMITISQIEIRPPGFKARNISLYTLHLLSDILITQLKYRHLLYYPPPEDFNLSQAKFYISYPVFLCNTSGFESISGVISRTAPL